VPRDFSEQNLTLSAVESASSYKLARTVAVVAASDNSGVDDTDGVPADEELGAAARVSGSRKASARAGMVDGDAGDSASVAIATVQRASKNLQRPVGKQRALAMQNGSRVADAIARGAAGIEKLAEASHKKTRLYNEILKLDRDRADTEKFKANFAQFVANGTDPVLRELYVKKMQERVLAELAVAAGTAESTADSSTAGAYAISPLAPGGGARDIPSED
jgi:hypothetical protein